MAQLPRSLYPQKQSIIHFIAQHNQGSIVAHWDRKYNIRHHILWEERDKKELEGLHISARLRVSIFFPEVGDRFRRRANFSDIHRSYKNPLPGCHPHSSWPQTDTPPVNFITIKRQFGSSRCRSPVIHHGPTSAEII